jgi:hypothetical protein
VKKIPSLEKLFKGRHCEREIIVLCVRWELRFKLLGWTAQRHRMCQ